MPSHTVAQQINALKSAGRVDSTLVPWASKFDHTRLTYRFSGRDMRLTDVHGHVIRDVLA